ncbi:hypothetical protein ACFQQB_06910 [Nonomuraea rubra]|uniref:hypothetical protein n=1 Tax=Nonomuraea rubra TaxID=46180 RepID=UPI0036124D31
MPLADAYLLRLDRRAVLVHPDPAQAQRRPRQARQVAARLRLAVGRVEPAPGALQVTVLEQRALAAEDGHLDVGA